MKKINLLIIFLVLFSSSFGQDDGVEALTEEQAMALPWFGNDEFIQNFIDDRLGSAPEGGRTDGNTSLDARYYVPLRLVIYRDNSGDPTSAISDDFAYLIVDKVNDIFDEANTGIKFFVQYTKFKNNNFYRENVNQLIEVGDLFISNFQTGVINVHLVRNVSGLAPGFAVNPKLPVFPNTRFSQYVETHDGSSPKNINELASTMAHELGHNLGLFHTHHPGRYESLIFNKDNATIKNDCYQEIVSRGIRNWGADGCVSTIGKKKCNINGDFLCDTEADPNVSSSNAVWVSSDCNSYTYTGGGDYEYDNRGKRWTPPLRNIMSYSRNECTREFSWGQRAIMWYILENDFMNDFDPNLEGPAIVCDFDPSTFSVKIPEEIGVTWTVSNNLSINLSNVGHSVSVIAKNNYGNDTGWVEAELSFPYGGTVKVRNSFEVDPPVKSKITFNRTSSYDFQNGRWNVLVAFYKNFGMSADNYTWEWRVPSSLVSHSDPYNSYINFKPRLEASSSIYIQTRACNDCGCSDWYGQWFNVVGSSGTPCDDSSGLPCRDYVVEY